MTVLDLRQHVLTALRNQPNLQVFDGRPDDENQPSVNLDPDGRVGMYAALYMGVGVPLEDRELASTHVGPLSLTFQVTAAGGDGNRALRAALKVRAALTGHRFDGWGAMREELDAVTARPDSADASSRWSVPMLYRVVRQNP